MMSKMFKGASSFAQTLCGAWYTSTADKEGMLDGSSGLICTTSASTSTPTSNGETTFMKIPNPGAD